MRAICRGWFGISIALLTTAMVRGEGFWIIVAFTCLTGILGSIGWKED